MTITRAQMLRHLENRISPKRMAEGGRVERPGALAAVWNAMRGMLSPGGDLNPTGGLVEPSLQGVMDAGDFAAEMVTPGPGIDAGIAEIRQARDAYGEGRYGDMLGHGISGVMQAGADLPMLGTFAGIGAKTADRAALMKAQDLADAGVDRRAIWDETGWFKGTDGRWRFEIDDSGASFNQKALADKDYRILDTVVHGREGQARDILPHDALYRAYPDMQGITISETYGRPNNRGTYYSGEPGSEGIGLQQAGIPESGRSTTLHEMQHAIQHRERFEPGGNVSMFRDNEVPNPRVAAYERALREVPEVTELQRMHASPEYLSELQRSNELFEQSFNPRINALDDEPFEIASKKIDDIFDEYKEVLRTEFPLLTRVEDIQRDLVARGIPTGRPRDTLTPDQAYRSLAGEVEARNVQARMDMTPDERRARPPWETQDVPDDMQIIRGRSDGPQMSVPMDQGFQSARVGETTIDYAVRPGDGVISVKRVLTPQKARGKGNARRAMDDLVAEADARGMTIALTPEPMDVRTTKGGLEKFYRSLGFVPNKGRAKDYSISESFIRPPRQGKTPILD